MRHHPASQIRPKIRTETAKTPEMGRRGLRSVSGGVSVVSANRKKLFTSRKAKLIAIHRISRVRVLNQDRTSKPAQTAQVMKQNS